MDNYPPLNGGDWGQRGGGFVGAARAYPTYYEAEPVPPPVDVSVPPPMKRYDVVYPEAVVVGAAVPPPQVTAPPAVSVPPPASPWTAPATSAAYRLLSPRTTEAYEIKDELIQRQEEFIIECMFPKRILPSNVKLREDNRPLSPSRIPGTKLSKYDIYGPKRGAVTISSPEKIAAAVAAVAAAASCPTSSSQSSSSSRALGKNGGRRSASPRPSRSQTRSGGGGYQKRYRSRSRSAGSQQSNGSNKSQEYDMNGGGSPPGSELYRKSKYQRYQDKETAAK